MSWTNECTDSNYFKVKNPKEVRNVLESMGFDVYENEGSLRFITSGQGIFFDEDTKVLSSKDTNGKVLGVYSSTLNISGNEEQRINPDEGVVTPVVEYLQEQLLDKQYITITCAGFESRSSGSFDPFGDVTIITKQDVKFVSLAGAVRTYLKENNLAT